MACPTQLNSRNLPVGWRFHPTDEELLCNYLKPTLLGYPIHSSDVEEHNICDYDPWDLVGASNTNSAVRYIISPCEYNNKGTLRKRKARGGGYWKCTGDPRPIVLGDSNEMIGTKRSLVYRNPGDTQLVKTEYAYTAKLEMPTVGDYVLYKIKTKSNNKNKASSKKNSVKAPSKKNSVKAPSKKNSVKGEPDCWKTRPNKKARTGESSNCKDPPTLAFENVNTKGKIATAACIGEGEATDHTAFDLVMMTSMSTYEKGESSYSMASDFDNQNLLKVISSSTSNNGGTSCLMASPIGNQNSHQMTTVSNYIIGDKSCYRMVSDLENVIPNKMMDMPSCKKSKPYCFRASSDKNQNSCGMPSASSYCNDEPAILRDFDVQNQTPTELTTLLFYDKAKTNCLVTLDYEIQDPCKRMDISASMEGQLSPLTEMPSDFDNQNQCQKTDMSAIDNYWNSSIASDVGETMFQEVQCRYKNIDKAYSGLLKAPKIGENPSEEVQINSQHKNADMPNPEDNQGLLMASDIGDAASIMVDPQELAEMMACLKSALLEPIHNDENSNCTQSHCEMTDYNHSPLKVLDIEKSTIIEIDPEPEELEEILAFLELKDVLNQQQASVPTKECINLNSLGTGLSNPQPQELEEILTFLELEDILNQQQAPVPTEESPNPSSFGTGMST